MRSTPGSNVIKLFTVVKTLSGTSTLAYFVSTYFYCGKSHFLVSKASVTDALAVSSKPLIRVYLDA
jgi:hypothetical protein